MLCHPRGLFQPRKSCGAVMTAGLSPIPLNSLQREAGGENKPNPSTLLDQSCSERARRVCREGEKEAGETVTAAAGLWRRLERQLCRDRRGRRAAILPSSWRCSLLLISNPGNLGGGGGRGDVSASSRRLDSSVHGRPRHVDPGPQPAALRERKGKVKGDGRSIYPYQPPL
ncbi:uncharacterized protein ACOB8E_001669 [Sarcophilus harrisii]